MSNRRRRSNAAPKQVENPSLLDHLVLMRESGPYAALLMQGMIQQTLTKVQHLPGAQELLAASMDVFTDPYRWGAVTKKVGSSRMAMVERDGVLYVYSLGTAAKNDLADGNAFVIEIVKILEHYHPRETWVSSFTRLLRSANYMSELLKAFAENTDLLNCEMVIAIKTGEGKMQFQFLAMFAASERDYILRRHTIGRVSQFQRGEWIPSSFPLGYLKRDRELVLDEDGIDITRQTLTILADLSLTTAECARRIGALGVTSSRISKLHGTDATVADVRNPSEAIATLVEWVDAYATGSYELLWPNPFPGVTEFAGVDVELLDGYDHGALRLTQRLPLPEGGWADDATIDAIRQRRSTPSLTGGASHDNAPPLSGLFQYGDANWEFAIGTGPGTYTLLQRPKNDDRVFTGWNAVSETDVIRLATVSRSAWHRSIADAVLKGVEEGLPAELDTQRFQAVGSLPPINAARATIRAIRLQLADATASLERAKRNARLAEGDDIAATFIDDAKRFNTDVMRLQRELERLLAEEEEPELDTTFESNAELVAYAIAALANADDSDAAVLRSSLRSVLSRERWRIDGEVLHWELFVELPHEQGTVVLGPVRGEVSCRPYRQRGKVNKRNSVRTTRKTLVAHGLSERAARSVAASTDPILSDVLVAHLTKRELPGDVDAEWAAHLIAVYTDADFEWSNDKWQLPDDVRKAALDAFISAGRPLSRSEVLAAGVSESQLRYLTRVTNAPSGDPILRRVGPQRGAPYALVDCPHCGGLAAHSVVTPETRPGILCTTCWRTPTPNSPIFPEWYRA